MPNNPAPADPSGAPDPLGTTTTYVYDGDGRAVRVAPLGTTTTYAYGDGHRADPPPPKPPDDTPPDEPFVVG